MPMIRGLLQVGKDVTLVPATACVKFPRIRIDIGSHL